MKIETLCRRILLLGLTAVFCLTLCPAALAAEPADIRLELGLSEGTVTYRAASDVERENVIAVTAVYKDGRMVGSRFDRVNLSGEPVGNSHSFSAAFDDVKVFLLDGARFNPLCPSGGYRQVTFLDHDGTVLSEQSVLSGQTAAPPVVDGREGYIFAGWDGDYSKVYEHCAFTALYIPDDSPNVFTVSSADGAVGEEVVVSVALSGAVRLCGYDMNLVYDNSVLELVSLDSELSMDVLANPIVKEGRVKFNFGSRIERTNGGGIMDITFRVLRDDVSYTPITIKPVEVIAIDPADSMKFIDADFTVLAGGVRIK